MIRPHQANTIFFLLTGIPRSIVSGETSMNTSLSQVMTKSTSPEPEEIPRIGGPEITTTATSPSQLQIPPRAERLPGKDRVAAIEQWTLAYPHLDRFQINLAIEFDEMMAEKFGNDYVIDDHLDEIFPEDKSVAAQATQDDGQGKESSSSDSI